MNTDVASWAVHVEKTDTCWLWKGGRDRRGYGRFGGRIAHRVVYSALVGPIPEGLELDHLCLVIACVNPAHLEPVTPAENMRRRYATYTRCVNGHAYTAANTYIRPSGHRDCRVCVRERARRYKARQQERQAAA